MEVEIIDFLPVEWNLMRLGVPAHGIVTKTVQKTLPGLLSVYLKLGPMHLLPVKFTKEIVYYLLGMPVLAFFGVNVVNWPGF